MQLQGVIKQIIQNDKNPRFTKKELILKTFGDNPQLICIEFGDRLFALLDNYRQGEEVVVGIRVKGREWVDKRTGECRYFNSIQGHSISPFINEHN